MERVWQKQSVLPFLVGKMTHAANGKALKAFCLAGSYTNTDQ